MSITNNLESRIIKAAQKAQAEYEAMSGWWLSHGPEYFLTSIVGNLIAKRNGFLVFPESSPKKIAREVNEKPKRGRPSNIQSKRFDLVIWNKTSDSLRAIIEIKKAWKIDPLFKDKAKIHKYLKSCEPKQRPAGYLLVYTEAKGTRRKKTLDDLKTKWASRLDCKFIASKVDAKGDGEWGWAFYLFRVGEA